MTRIVTIAICLIVAGASGAHHAEAQQTDDAATARQLFKQARAFMKEGKFQAASELLERALQLDVSPGYVLNLAVCYEELERWASAWVRYREAEKLAKERGSKPQRDYASARIKSIAVWVPRLTIAAPPRPTTVAVQIQLDGQPLPSASLAGAIPVDPGPHIITAQAPGYRSYSTEIDIIDAGHVKVELPALLPEPGQERRVVESVPRAPRRRHKKRRPLAIALASTGGATIAAGLGVGLSAKLLWDDAFASGACEREPLKCTPDGQAQTDAVRYRGRVANILVGTGAGALVAGIAIMLIARKGNERPSTSARSFIAPGIVGPGAFGLTVRSQF